MEDRRADQRAEGRSQREAQAEEELSGAFDLLADVLGTEERPPSARSQERRDAANDARELAGRRRR